MIPCPECGGCEVFEERHLPMPRGPGRWIPWLYAVLALPPLIICAGLGFFGPTMPFLAFFQRLERAVPAGSSGEFFKTVVGCASVPLLLFAIMIGVLIASLGAGVILTGIESAFKSLAGIFRPEGGWLFQYRRTCWECGHRWDWKPDGVRNKVRAPRRVRRSKRKLHSKGDRPASEKERRAALQRLQTSAYQRYLDELIAHWEGKHVPDPDHGVLAGERALHFFESYQWALGEPAKIKAGHSPTGFIRRHFPGSIEKQNFVAAYGNLQRGDRETAVRMLKELTQTHHRFAEAWLWRSATTDDPEERRIFLETAAEVEPAHPLALNALAWMRGDLSPDGAQPGRKQETIVTIVRCPKCGGSLRYQPGESRIECAYCGQAESFRDTGVAGLRSLFVRTLRLQRLYQGQAWREAERIIHCGACGAEVTMTRHLARECFYCGSTQVLVADSARAFEKPDGILPFQIDQQKAITLVRAATGSRAARQDALELQGVYLPFWIFDGEVELRWLHLKGDRVLYASQDRTMDFNSLMFPGVNTPPISILDQIPPYELDALVPYEPRLVADWPAQLYNLDVEVVVEDAYDAMLVLANRKAGPPMVMSGSSASDARTARIIQVNKTSYRLALFPVWVATVGSNEARALVVVNGQTGEVHALDCVPGFR